MNGGERGLTKRQLAAVVWTGVLAPAIGVLPGAAARTAREAGWLSVLMALPVVLGVGWIIERLTRGGEMNLVSAYSGSLGRIPGAVITIIYIVWSVVFSSVRLRLSVERLRFSVWQGGGQWACLPAVLLLSVWLARGKSDAFGRAGEVFFGVAITLLASVTLLAAPQVRAQNLWPFWTEEVASAGKSAEDALGVLSAGICGGILMGGVKEDNRGEKWVWSTVIMCTLLTVVQAVILGNFGAELTARLEDPFMTLSGSVGVKGAFQRVESLASVLWLYSDVVMLALLLRAAIKLWNQIHPKISRDGAMVTHATMSLAGAVLGFRDGAAARQFECEILKINILVGIFLPVAAFLAVKVLRKGGKEGTSCGMDS